MCAQGPNRGHFRSRSAQHGDSERRRDAREELHGSGRGRPLCTKITRQPAAGSRLSRRRSFANWPGSACRARRTRAPASARAGKVDAGATPRLVEMHAVLRDGRPVVRSAWRSSRSRVSCGDPPGRGPGRRPSSPAAAPGPRPRAARSRTAGRGDRSPSRSSGPPRCTAASPRSSPARRTAVASADVTGTSMRRRTWWGAARSARRTRRPGMAPWMSHGRKGHLDLGPRVRERHAPERRSTRFR